MVVMVPVGVPVETVPLKQSGQVPLDIMTVGGREKDGSTRRVPDKASFPGEEYQVGEIGRERVKRADGRKEAPES